RIDVVGVATFVLGLTHDCSTAVLLAIDQYLIHAMLLRRYCWHRGFQDRASTLKLLAHDLFTIKPNAYGWLLPGINYVYQKGLFVVSSLEVGRSNTSD